jgi:hypothetical protein
MGKGHVGGVDKPNMKSGELLALFNIAKVDE